MIRKTIAEFGGLDAAFNNAGGPGEYSTAVTCATEAWEAIIRLNMTSVWLCMKHEIPEMMKRGRGAIVNTASLSGIAANPNMLGYVATKHAVVGLTRSAAIDFAGHNIRVNAVCPGMIDTPMLRAAIAGSGLVVPDLVQGVPLGRAGVPEEIAETVIWLCSQQSTYVTGAIINIDGGTMACCT
jgi:NAD(P)-dependent dehydrogenase (short-subunit alcohol dehydrogenase family)